MVSEATTFYILHKKINKWNKTFSEFFIEYSIEVLGTEAYIRQGGNRK